MDLGSKWLPACLLTVITLGGHHRIDLSGWSRPIDPKWTSDPGPNIRPTSKQRASTPRKPIQTGHIKNDLQPQKPQVRTGAPPGTRTPNPRIKSPLLSSILLPELVPSDDETCRYLPFCAGARIRGGLRIPRAAGLYRDIRANMERTSLRTGLDHHGRGPLDRGR